MTCFFYCFASPGAAGIFSGKILRKKKLRNLNRNTGITSETTITESRVRRRFRESQDLVRRRGRQQGLYRGLAGASQGLNRPEAGPAGCLAGWAEIRASKTSQDASQRAT